VSGNVRTKMGAERTAPLAPLGPRHPLVAEPPWLRRTHISRSTPTDRGRRRTWSAGRLCSSRSC